MSKSYMAYKLQCSRPYLLFLVVIPIFTVVESISSVREHIGSHFVNHADLLNDNIIKPECVITPEKLTHLLALKFDMKQGDRNLHKFGKPK